jgi:hypothetical protein
VTVKAYVLIVTDPGATKGVYDALSKIEGLVELHEVMGPYDIVAEIDVPQLVDVPPILSTKIRAIPGIQSTTSLGVFPGAVGVVNGATDGRSPVMTYPLTVSSSTIRNRKRLSSAVWSARPHERPP